MSNRGRHRRTRNRNHILVTILGEEICKKMLNNQINQGNPYDLDVFFKDPTANQQGKGFTWNRTPEGFCFWNDIATTINKYKQSYGRS